jgi:hypothetical protein
MYFKQVPANLGNYVVVNDDASGAGNGFIWTYNVTTGNVNVPDLTAGAQKSGSNGVGTVYRDLGVTYVEKSPSGSMQNVYRKVVKASDSALDPTEVFIKIVNATAGSPGSTIGKVHCARLG